MYPPPLHNYSVEKGQVKSRKGNTPIHVFPYNLIYS